MKIISLIPNWIKNIPYTYYKEVSNNFIRLDLAINKYPPSPQVKKILLKSIRKINSYPETNWSLLREKIAEYNAVNSNEILVTNGLEEAIDIITRTFVTEGKEILILTPTYSQFAVAALRVCGKVRKIRLKESTTFKIPIEKIENVIKKKNIKLIWICNPNNPTGTLFNKKDILSVIKNSNCPVIIDECFYEFANETLVDKIQSDPRIFILRSFSKSFSLAGIRIGYIMSNENSIKELLRMRQPSSVNLLAQYAALISLNNLDYYKNIWKKIKLDREELKKELENLGLKVFPSSTNLLFIKTEKAKYIFKKLFKCKIFVLPSWNSEFTNNKNDTNYLRILVGLPKENEILINTLKKILKKY